MWDPEAEYWGEEGEPLPDWTREIIARGSRSAFEMEQVIPREDPDDFDSDPILEANDLLAAGRRPAAKKLLLGLLSRDLRCLDAHAHLGSLEFDGTAQQALRHFEAGVSIGALTLGTTFDGVIPWGLIDNRPYLRCLNGLALCLWRFGHIQRATALFERMLWLNPADNQGARINVGDVRAGRPWRA